MIAFHRLSTVPTIPELLRQDRERWVAQARRALPPPWHLPTLRAGGPVRAALLSAWTWRTRMATCFAGADLLLAAARLLNGCGLLSPEGIGAFFAGAERLTRAGMGAWHASRRERRLREHVQGEPSAPGGRCGGTRASDHLTGASRPCA